MTKEETRTIQAIIALLMLPLRILLYAFVTAQLWLWFVTPLGLPALGKAHAYGLASMVGYITRDLSWPKTDEDKSPLRSTLLSFTSAGMMLLGGYICHRIMVG